MSRPDEKPTGFVRPDLAALASRLPPRPLTRFAPSPTGHLHLGHVVNAVYVWGLARAIGGRVLLRIEDHDRQRSRAEYEAAILEDLAWLGLEPDNHESADRAAIVQQRACAEIHESALRKLNELDLVYACACSRRDIGRASPGEPAHHPEPDGSELRYAGTCRDRGLEAIAGRGLRVKMDPGGEGFDDALLGPQRQEPASQCGDVLVRDRVGQWTYQFAVTVDDLTQGIHLVIRGADLLESTGRQIRLARLLGRASPPVFLHHPLLFGPDGRKLSKSDGAIGIGELRERGVSAAEVLGLAAARVGLLERATPLAASRLAALFDVRRERRGARSLEETPPRS